MTRPILTLYIYKNRGHAVAAAIGQVPPDPGGLDYDSLMRIPVVINGDRPHWRAFTWYVKESIGAAMHRARWPDEEDSQTGADLHLNNTIAA